MPDSKARSGACGGVSNLTVCLVAPRRSTASVNVLSTSTATRTRGSRTAQEAQVARERARKLWRKAMKSLYSTRGLVNQR